MIRMTLAGAGKRMTHIKLSVLYTGTDFRDDLMT